MNCKKLCSLLSLMLLFCVSSAQEDNSTLTSYLANGKVVFKLSTDKILIKFSEETKTEDKKNIISSISHLTSYNESFDLPAPRVTIVPLSKGVTETQLEEIITELESNTMVDYANPFLVYEDGTEQVTQNKILVQLKNAADYSQLETMAEEMRATIEQRNEFEPLLYHLSLSKNSDINTLEAANKLHLSGYFEFAEPDFIKFLKRFATNDTYYYYQWALENTGSSLQGSGTADADMDIPEAWAISAGSSNIKVAILDEGVDLAHPDLQGNLLPGYDATGQGSGGAPSGDDAHGTACAGVVAAVANNGKGTAGVAPGCKIVPVRIAYSSGTSWVTTDSWIVNAINWAWQTAGADVLSNSWGGGSWSSARNSAIHNSVTNGRGGLGAPVFFAAGNDNGSVDYPAVLDDVISVAAMSMCNERKSPNSCDGEYWWGSNYGTDLDVSAPGVQIATADISGFPGYVSTDYVYFNGTSSACPHAAGVMALILSANPSLNFSDARYAIESTCSKVGGYSYNSNVSGQPNGTWSSQLGYGMVNAHQALLAVQPAVVAAPVANFSGTPRTICEGETVSFTSLSTNSPTSYQWNFGDGGLSNLANPSHVYDVPGVYAVSLTACNPGGCDSENKTAYITVLAHTEVTQNVHICSGETYYAGGAFRSASGTYYDTYTASNGCDSTVQTNLTVVSNSSTIQNVTICSGETYYAGGAFRSASGTYYDTYTVSNGCDSTVQTNLNVLSNSSTIQNVTICSGETYYAGGAFQTATGAYTDVYTAVNGCDSTVTTNLTVVNGFTSTNTVDICDGEHYYAGGAFQTTSGIYTDAYLSGSGCDSIVTTVLTVHPAYSTTVDVTICEGEVYNAGGNKQTTTGTYTDTYINVYGCDSVVITNLTVLPVPVTTVNAEICEGESYYAGGSFQTTAGIYTDRLTGSNGCDSIVETNLTVLPNSATTVNVSICQGESYFAGGAGQTTSGNYADVYTAANGCDSIVTTNLTVTPLDACGVCGGDNSTCTDCAGVINGNAAIDSCGICRSQSNPDFNNCDPCLGVVCNGNKICIDGVCVNQNGNGGGDGGGTDPCGGCPPGYSCKGNTCKPDRGGPNGNKGNKASIGAEASTSAMTADASMLKAYPNPFTQMTTIEFILGHDDNVQLQVYDIRGSLVTNLYSGKVSAGAIYTFTLEATELKDGIYFGRLISSKQVQLIKLIVQK